eukprot:867894-Rhodomonas_salina.2
MAARAQTSSGRSVSACSRGLKLDVRRQGCRSGSPTRPSYTSCRPSAAHTRTPSNPTAAAQSQPPALGTRSRSG